MKQGKPITQSVNAMLLGVAATEAARFVSDAREPNTPVDVDALLGQVNATIDYTDMDEEGSVQRTGDGYVVRINRNVPATRQRFTLAHELGHIVLGRLTQTDSWIRYRWKRGRPEPVLEERFCDLFASRLLIPDSSLIDLNDWRTISLARIVLRAQQLNVSYSAMMGRIVEVLPGRAGGLWVGRCGKPTDSQAVAWRIRWGYFPDDAYKRPYRLKSIPPESLLSPDRISQGQEQILRNVSLEFCGLSERRSMLVCRKAETLLALVFPPGAEVETIRRTGQTAIQSCRVPDA
jgi:hypothetical protein